LRNLAESEPKPLSENFAIKEAIGNGEMVSKESLDKLIRTNILQLMNKKGIIIDGFPRDMTQIQDFQEKVSMESLPLRFVHTFIKLFSIQQYNQNPPIVLLDCSKLQLGRGRLDDSVSSFRRRLELFRELTLPMLKTLDSDGRLTIVS
jgi:adenylate kinase family enzyme